MLSRKASMNRPSTVSASEARWFYKRCRLVGFEIQMPATDLHRGFPVGLHSDNFAMTKLKHKLAGRVKSRVGPVITIAVDALTYSAGRGATSIERPMHGPQIGLKAVCAHAETRSYCFGGCVTRTAGIDERAIHSLVFH